MAGNMTLTIRPAHVGELDRVLALLTQTIGWLREQGTDQWSTWSAWPTTMRHALHHGDVWLLFRHDDPIGTITLQYQGNPALWTPTELRQPAGYVSKLTIHRDHAGEELGALLLAWAGDRAYDHGCTWLRLDAWKTNTRLHAYYTHRGWTHLRTSTNPDYHSGALFQRPAHPLPRRQRLHAQQP